MQLGVLTGTGRASTQSTYLYPGGPTSAVKHYDESGNLTRQVNYVLGQEGEILSRSGGIEPQTMLVCIVPEEPTQGDWRSDPFQT